MRTLLDPAFAPPALLPFPVGESPFRQKGNAYVGDLRYLDAVAPGGSMHQKAEEFFEWASHYDDGTREGRNLARHQAWLAALRCRVIRLDGVRPLPDLVSEVRVAIEA